MNVKYLYPPEKLIIAQYVNGHLRPSEKNARMAYSRDKKKYAHMMVRNMLLKYGISGDYIGLCGRHPDDIAIQLHPIIKKIIGYEIDVEFAEKIIDFAKTIAWHSGFDIDINKGNIFSAELNKNMKVYDFDFDFPIDNGTAQNIIDFVNRIPTKDKFGLMIWSACGRVKGETDSEILFRLDNIIEEINKNFNIIDSFEYEYTGNKIPMRHRAYVLQRKGESNERPK